jgi:tRNA uracil 4-sulfurtransferase
MKAVSLISDGIDSPIAAYFALKQGIDVIFLHCSWNELALSKVKKNIAILEKVTGKKTALYTVDFSSLQKEISENCRIKFMCLYCKRSMYRLAEALAKEIDADCIVTGENIGQVASQTIDNLKTIHSAVNIPVIHPLIAFDKQEIINIAKKVGTFETSIIKNIGCPFVPSQPATISKLKLIESEEGRINIPQRIAELLKNKKKIL